MIVSEIKLADLLPRIFAAAGYADLPAIGRYGLDDVPLELSFPAVRHVSSPARVVIMRNSLAFKRYKEKST